MSKPIFWDLVLEFDNLDDGTKLVGFPLEENQKCFSVENPTVGKVEFMITRFLGQLMTTEQLQFIQSKGISYRFV